MISLNPNRRRNDYGGQGGLSAFPGLVPLVDVLSRRDSPWARMRIMGVKTL